MIYLILFFLISATLTSFSQKEYYNWYFGRNTGMTFNTPDGEPTSLDDSQMYTHEGSSVISDKNGNLLFYSNGEKIWDKSHNLLLNGHKLNGHNSATQSSIIIKKPLSNNLYFLFSLDTRESSEQNGLSYSIIDMSLNYGLGEVIQKNVQVYSPSTEKQKAVFHENEKDFWIITQDTTCSKFKVFLMSDKGLDHTPIISDTYFESNDNTNYASEINTSPCGNYLTSMWSNVGKIYLYQINKKNGKIAFLKVIDIPPHCSYYYSSEFSPDCKKIYTFAKSNKFSAWYNLVQYDISDIDHIKISTLKFNCKDLYQLGMSLGPNGKIYITQRGGLFNPTLTNKLSVINNPNEDIKNCGFVHNGLELSTGTLELGLPNFPKEMITQDIPFEGPIEICSGVTLELPNKVAWCMYKPTYTWTGPNDFLSNEIRPRIPNSTIDMTGWYYLVVNHEGVDKIKDSIYVEVKQSPNPQIVSEGSFNICNDKPVNLTLDKDYIDYEWTTGERIKNITVSEPGMIGVTVYNDNGCSTYTEVEITESDSLHPTIVGSESICEGDTIVLSTRGNYSEYEWSTGEVSDTIVVYLKGIYKVKVSSDDGCSGTSDEFTVTVNPLPEPEITGEIEICLGAEEAYTVDYIMYGEIKWHLSGGGQIVGKDDGTEVNIKWDEEGTWELSVEQSNKYNCFGNHTIEVTVTQTDKPEIIMNSPKLCPGSTMTLSVEEDYDSYTWYSSNWTDSRTGKEIEIDKIGSYILEVTSNGCIGLDTVFIEEADPIEVSIIGDKKICSGNPITLSADDDYFSYKWSTQEDSKEITITEAGNYILTVINDDGCTGTAEIEVTDIEIDIAFIDDDPIDFGEIELGNNSQRTVTIENNSEYDLVYSSRIDNQSAIQISQSDNTIELGKSQDIDLTFTPDYPQLYSDKLIIEVTEPCDYVIEKEITGAGYINTKVWIEDSTVYPDTKNYCIPIQTQITTDYSISMEIDYTAQIMTDASLIVPDINHITSGSDLVFDIQGSHNLSNTQNSINDICGWIIFADQKTTPIVINSFEWSDNKYIRVESEDGNIDMEHLCFDNLLHVESYQSTQINISPNPASDEISINISSQEKGAFMLKIITIEGIEINNRSWRQSTDRLVNKDINLDISNISSGAYIIMLQSPYGVISRQLNVVR